MTQNTAVDWLIDVLNDQQLLKNYPIQIFEQAKAMEKEQIKDAYDAATETVGFRDAYKNAKDYYNQTYKI